MKNQTPIPDSILNYFIHKEITPNDVSEIDEGVYRVKSLYDEGDFFMTENGLIQNHRVVKTDEKEMEYIALIDPNLNFKIVFEEII